MRKTTITIKTHSRNEMINITREIRQIVSEWQIEDGKITLHVPHTTAAVTINENADPDVKHDFLLGMTRISPDLREFRHLEGNSDAHLKSSIIGCTQDVIVIEKKLLLGTWQGIFFCEFDGPRTRKLYIIHV
jgi:secondary thiamine-phosphate synthase enzyme